jgi:hypothetical protein
MKRQLAMIALLLPALLAQGSGNGNGNNGRGANRPRGKVTGEYNLVIAGQYQGKGTANVSESTVTLSGTVIFPAGTTATLTIPPMKLVNDRFTGNGTINGISCSISGRVDLPDARDEETTDEQAVTGRFSATVRDQNGKTARIVGVQDSASRGGKPPGKPAE